MTQGRLAKPTVLKVLEGNAGKRPLNENEPEPLRDIPIPPIWLIDEAKAEWQRTTPKLINLGLLTDIDIPALIGYCQSWGRYVEAEKYLSDNDSVFITDKGYMCQVPQVGMAQKYLKQCQSLMLQFGMTPSSRGNMSFPGTDEEDSMERHLRAKR